MQLNNLQKLAQLGQSPWYDNIERTLIKNGELQKLFDQGVLGVTTNPSIFEKAISTSNAYDEDIFKLKFQGKNVLGIYDELTLYDVAQVADKLMEVYKKTSGKDGYVSLEVLPDFAHDTEKTIENARRLFAILKRKNIMIKIPATKEGLAAVKELIADGININVTLIFSLSQYEATASAFIEGLEEGIRRGKDITKVHSVASVFISRIDSYIDDKLQKMEADEKDANKKSIMKNLIGKIAIANTKVIYARYRDIFSNANFRKIKNNGGNIQRILWGSTSTKNPAYKDLKYVDELIGADSVNTIPHSTLFAFIDHGKPSLTIESNLNEAREDINKLTKSGIDLELACKQIQNDGIKAFQDAFNKLIASIDNKK
ncbi:transaldolase [Candidatus Poribacteria bacterium]|nr:transaldolase [Candidatus Poribacteria bacterium]